MWTFSNATPRCNMVLQKIAFQLKLFSVKFPMNEMHLMGSCGVNEHVRAFEYNEIWCVHVDIFKCHAIKMQYGITKTSAFR